MIEENLIKVLLQNDIKDEDKVGESVWAEGCYFQMGLFGTLLQIGIQLEK